MKSDTHPEMHPVVFRDAGAGVDFVGLSTTVTEEKEEIDGVPHSVIPIEISSASHPFYTGEDNIVDSAGRVEKFKARADKRGAQGESEQKQPAQKSKASQQKKSSSAGARRKIQDLSVDQLSADAPETPDTDPDAA